MLVMSRERGEEVVIGGEIVVSVVEIRGEKVRLGFTAPRDVPINRREVQDRLEQEGNDTKPRTNLRGEGDD